MNKVHQLSCGALLLLAHSANAAPVAAGFETAGEERLSLGGLWKFKALESTALVSNETLKVQPGDIVVDDEDAGAIEVAGDWTRSTWSEGGAPWKGSYLVTAKRSEGANASVSFKPPILKAQSYQVFANWSQGERDRAVKITINHTGGSQTVSVDQTQNGGRWLNLGRYAFAPGAANSIKVEAGGAGAQVVADAFLLRPVNSLSGASATPGSSAGASLFSPTLSDASWDSMRVPGNWDTSNAYAHHVGKAWYRRTVAPPRNWRGSRIRLRFEAVYHDAQVYLNGQKLGEHVGGYTPFEFDVTNALRYDRPNVLAVQADNTYRRGAWWAWGGISRDVNLIRNTDVRIAQQHVWAEPDLAKGTAQISTRLTLVNSARTARTVLVASQIGLRGGALVPALSRRVQLRAGESQLLVWNTTLPANRTKLWHFDRPNLYEIQTSLTQGSRALHHKTDRFGIRKIQVTPDTLLLNGEPIRVPGFNRVHDHRAWGNMEPEHLVRADIDRMKRAGAVMTRIMHGPQAPNLLDYADEKGLLLFCEIPVWGSGDPRMNEAGYTTTKRWMAEMIGRDFNHPSIIGWSVGNELTNHFDFVREMLATTRRDLDPHRLLAYVSFTGARGGVSAQNDPITFSDLTLHNSYGSLGRITQILRPRWPDKPIFYSEFGASQIGLGLDSKIPRFESNMDAIRGTNSFVIGHSLWTFNDYRSAYAGTPASEDRAWGVVNNWRQPKRAFEQVALQHSPIRSLTLQIDGERALIRLEPRGVTDFPAYALRGYKLQWEARAADGTIAHGARFDLPDIKPGAALTRDVEWKIPAAVREVVLSLISPTDTVAHQSRESLSVAMAPRIVAVVPGDKSARVVFEPVAGADEYQVIATAPGQPAQESQATIETQATLTGLNNGTSYSFSVVALNSKGRSQPSGAALAAPNGQALPPIVWKAVPLDGGFMLGYSVETEDLTFNIQYGMRPNRLSQSLPDLHLKGAASVMGLKNGTPIYFRIQRAGDYGQSGWSPVQSVVPNGGLPPATPRLRGGVRGPGAASLRFDPVEQATGYRIRTVSRGTTRTVEVNAAWVDQATVTGLDDTRDYSFSIASVGQNGTSAFSTPITLRASRK